MNYAVLLGLFGMIKELADQAEDHLRDDGNEAEALEQLAHIEQCAQWLRREFQRGYTKKGGK
jgi:hypothetical protein